MTHVGGQLQAQFMSRVRGRIPERCLVVPIDVASPLPVCWWPDHYRKIFVSPFDFPLTETGFGLLATG